MLTYHEEASEAETEIQRLVDKILDSENAREIMTLERRIDDQERRKTIAVKKVLGDLKPIMPMEKVFLTLHQAPEIPKFTLGYGTSRRFLCRFKSPTK